MGPAPCPGSLAAVCSQGFLPLGSAPLDPVRVTGSHQPRHVPELGWHTGSCQGQDGTVTAVFSSCPGLWGLIGALLLLLFEFLLLLSHCWVVLGTFQ